MFLLIKPSQVVALIIIKKKHSPMPEDHDVSFLYTLICACSASSEVPCDGSGVVSCHSAGCREEGQAEDFRRESPVSSEPSSGSRDQLCEMPA